MKAVHVIVEIYANFSGEIEFGKEQPSHETKANAERGTIKKIGLQ